MSTVEERFDLALTGVKSVVETLTTMKNLGIYGREELVSGVVLLTALERAMRVLDPERTEEYAKSEMAKAQDTFSKEVDQLSDKSAPGLYM
jgi:hypothetical protein